MVQQFRFEKTGFPEVIRITPFSASDDRGGIVKDYAEEPFAENGILFTPVETIYIESHKGVLRGLHFQRVQQQPKLIRCLSGKVWSAIVDIRKESPSFGKWISEEISERNSRALFVPEGFAFGTLAMEDSLLSSKCGQRFYAEYDSGIYWNDPDLDIQWPIDQTSVVIISEKDKRLQSLKEYREST